MYEVSGEKNAFIVCIFISGTTYYEVKKGLLAVNATSKLSTFNALCRREFRVL